MNVTMYKKRILDKLLEPKSVIRIIIFVVVFVTI